MADTLLIAKAGNNDLCLLPALSNRHGLITGATGTGKTVTLQTMAEQFSRIGVPVFMADVKGDLSGIAAAGGNNQKSHGAREGVGRGAALRSLSGRVLGRVRQARASDPRDGVGLGAVVAVAAARSERHAGRCADAGVQDRRRRGVAVARSQGSARDTTTRRRASAEYTTEYGNASVASIGAIQRELLTLSEQGAEQLFGEPMLNIADLLQTSGGRGVVNILAADQLLGAPKLYATLLLWMLAELFEHLPEVGDPDKPKLVFFFDEAHLLFTDAPRPLLEKIEQVVRLIRSKGVGVYFVTQNPLDVPDTVLGQLGNRVQHALRAFTPRDQKAVKSAADTMRPNPALEIEQVITELGVGEALVSFLDVQGRPAVTQRALIVPPGSQIGPIDAPTRTRIIASSAVASFYEKAVDRESAYEVLKARTAVRQPEAPPERDAPIVPVPQQPANTGRSLTEEILFGRRGPRGGQQTQGLVEAMAKSAARAVGSQAGRALLRGVLGSLLGGGRR